MNLNFFENLAKDIKSNDTIKNFMEDLTDFLGNPVSTQSKESSNEIQMHKNRQEGHLYLVTEDRGNEVYLWDFTDKPKNEFKEIISSEELLSVAKEGAMLQFKNGKYELYSTDGYDMLYNEEK